MRRARPVASTKSFSAPVVTSPMAISSAVRPYTVPPILLLSRWPVRPDGRRRNCHIADLHHPDRLCPEIFSVGEALICRKFSDCRDDRQSTRSLKREGFIRIVNWESELQLVPLQDRNNISFICSGSVPGYFLVDQDCLAIFVDFGSRITPAKFTVDVNQLDRVL